MNYSNLPVYIRKSEDSQLPFANVYDPPGIDNSLYLVNLSTAQTLSVQYLSGTEIRVSGSATTYPDLYLPKPIKVNSNVKIYLPRFRSLIFFNLDGSRAKDPAYPTDNLPPLYFSGYNTGTSSIDYVNHNKTNYYLRLRWSGASDTYSLEYFPIGGGTTPQEQLIYSSGTGFSSGWKLYAGGTYTGIVCSGLGATAENIKNTINDPTGQSLYYINGVGNNVYEYNSNINHTKLTGVLSAKPVNGITGYASPHSLLNLGKAYHYIPAQNISVEYSAQNDALRLLGADIDKNDQFTHGAALQAKISFNSYVNTEVSGGLSTVLGSSGNDAYDIRFGNNIYSGCYLSDYGINLEPFRPIALRANYIINDAPKINSNNQSYINVATEGSANYLFDSESMTGANYIYTNLGAFGLKPDPTGGEKATLISGSSNAIAQYSYSVNNNNATGVWATISGAGGILLTTLQSNDDISTGILFTSSKKFQMGDATEYGKVWISNNGIISFDSQDEGYSSYQNQEFPIASTTKKFIAAYWRDMFASVGRIYYKQEADKFIIEYVNVNASNTSEPQTYQVVLYFTNAALADRGLIKIIYKKITQSGTFNPDANVGIQWSTSDYINYGLSYVDSTKELKFIRETKTATVGPNFIYKKQITPSQTRTFSIHLKRDNGVGDIKYTLNSGINWTTISPALTNDWQRYSFPSNINNQQVGIQVETSGDRVYIYGGQLEPLSYMTDYIPTSGITALRSGSSTNVEVDIVSPIVDFSTGFANSTIAGNTCSISSTTGFINNIQSSLSYSVNCGRSPVYNLGTTNAKSFILDSVEKQMDISSTNLASFIDFYGTNLSSDLNLILKDSKNITGAAISMKSGANIYSQQSSIQEGDTLTTQVSIKEIVI